MKLDNANANRLYCIIGAGVVYVEAAAYGAGWRQGQRNKVCIVCVSGAGLAFLNGVQYATTNSPFTMPNPTYFYIGASMLSPHYSQERSTTPAFTLEP